MEIIFQQQNTLLILKKKKFAAIWKVLNTTRNVPTTKICFATKENNFQQRRKVSTVEKFSQQQKIIFHARGKITPFKMATRENIEE